jgi:hypothetical protein
MLPVKVRQICRDFLCKSLLLLFFRNWGEVRTPVLCMCVSSVCAPLVVASVCASNCNSLMFLYNNNAWGNSSWQLFFLLDP